MHCGRLLVVYSQFMQHTGGPVQMDIKYYQVGQIKSHAGPALARELWVWHMCTIDRPTLLIGLYVNYDSPSYLVRAGVSNSFSSRATQALCPSSKGCHSSSTCVSTHCQVKKSPYFWPSTVQFNACSDLFTSYFHLPVLSVSSSIIPHTWLQ